MNSANLEALEHAKIRTELYTNKRKEHQLLSRVRKFLYAPKKVARVALYRVGFLRNPDVTVDMFWGSAIRLPLWDEDAVIAYYTGSFGPAELPLVAYLVRTLDSASVFYDIGSNLGLYSALAHALGAEVHSFEPNHRTVHYIAMNAQNAATAHAIAVSDTNDRVPFYEVAIGRKIGMSSFFPDMVPQTREQKPHVMEVQTTTLDTYAEKHRPPTVMKIDVMNADFLVLKGGRSVLERHAPVIALRLYHNPIAPARSEETLALLGSLGYKSFWIEADGRITPTEVILRNIKFASTFIFIKP